MRILQLRPLAAALAAAALVGTAGCAGSSSPPVRPSTSPATATPLWVSGTTRLPGTLYVLAGPKDISANVYEVSGAGQALRAMTANPPDYGISQFAASSAGVAVATAERGFDQLRILDSASSKPTEAAASAPSINARGEVLVARPTKNSYVIDRYRIRGAKTPTASVYLPAEAHQSTAVWGAGGTVVTARRTEAGLGGPTEIGVRSASGGVLRTTVLHGMYVDLLSNPYPDRQPITGFRTDSAGGGAVFGADLMIVGTVPAPWSVGCWNPSGSALLVSQGRKVGLWHPRTGRITIVGEAQVRIRGCAWLSAPAAGTAAVVAALARTAPAGK